MKIANLLYVLVVALNNVSLAPASQQASGLLLSEVDNKDSANRMMMPFVAPLFIESEGTSSEITVVNPTAADSTASLVLKDQQGEQVVSKKLVLKAHSKQVIEVSDLLELAHILIPMGSVELMPEGKTAQNMSLAAQLSIINLSQPSPIYLEEEFLMPTVLAKSVYHASSSGALGLPSIALLSMSSDIQLVTLTCVEEQARTPKSNQMQLSPGQMMVVRGCDVTSTKSLSVEEIWTRSLASSVGTRGLEVTTTSQPGGLAVFGFEARGNPENHTYQSLNFEDVGLRRSSTTVFAGIPVGKSDLFPNSVFTPEISLVNFSKNPIETKVVYAQTFKGDSAKEELVTNWLKPHSAKTLLLSSLKGDPQLQNSFVIEANGSPGALAVSIHAIDEASENAVQVIGHDSQQIQNGGIHPWDLKDGKASTLLLFNYSPTKQQFTVRIAAKKVLWIKAYSLNPSETRAIDIQAVVNTREKDQSGNSLPTGSTNGEVNWSVESAGKGTGRMLISRSDASLSRNFSCSIQEVGCGFDLQNSSLDLLIDTQGQVGPTIASFCTTGSLSNTCSGDFDYSQNQGPDTWDSSDTTIATIAGNGALGNVGGVGGGTSVLTASANIMGCPYFQIGQATVIIPSYLTVSVGDRIAHSGDAVKTPDGQVVLSSCFGYSRSYTYRVFGTDTNPFNPATQTTETNTTSSSNPTYLKLTPTVTAGVTSSYFYDVQANCTNASPGPPVGSFIKGTQQIDVLVGRRTYSKIQMNSIDMEANDVTVTCTANCHD